MLLQYLIEDLNAKTYGETNKEITGVEYNSEKIKEGNLFVAIHGLNENGHSYIDSAIANGAVAVVVQNGESIDIQSLSQRVTIVEVEDSRIALAKIANVYYDRPSSKLKLIGITGTKGKTTTAYMIRDIMLTSGKKVGMIGTIYNTYGDKVLEADRTSPESLDLHRLLKDMVDSGIEYVVMEVSSHAIALNRVYGLHFEIGVFTNLGQEHLDFHGDMDTYLKTKAKLFEMCSFGIINSDDVYTTKLLRLVPCKYAKYGLDNESNVTATDIRINNNYTDFKMYINKHLETIRLGIPGKYSVYNALAAIAVTSMLGAQMQDILVSLPNIKVPGRSEIVDIEKSFAVLIDYAHTPESLESILINTKKYIKGRVICVFGCGGDRDKTKRPEMGRIAGKNADFTVITTDNPRTEKTKDIIESIEKGIKETKGLYKVIENRKEAIEFAMRIAWKNDTIILAGKGHEKYQIIGNKKIDFDEREIVKSIAEKMPGKEATNY